MTGILLTLLAALGSFAAAVLVVSADQPQGEPVPVRADDDAPQARRDDE